MKNQIRHLITMDKVYLWDVLAEINYTIMLYRQNIHHASLSHAISTKTGVWDTAGQLAAENVPFNLTNDEFDESMFMVLESLELLMDNPYNIRYNQIIKYEDLSGSHNVDYGMLDLSPTPPLTTPRLPSSQFTVDKTVPKQSLVLNYDKWHKHCAMRLANHRNPNLTFDGVNLVSARYKNII